MFSKITANAVIVLPTKVTPPACAQALVAKLGAKIMIYFGTTKYFNENVLILNIEKLEIN